MPGRGDLGGQRGPALDLLADQKESPAGARSREDAQALVDYVYSRPAGRPELEVGGVMVTLASLCSATSIDMTEAGDRELQRNWERIDAIRRKQASKPLGSPLPQ